MNEINIVIQKELDKCNENQLKYEKKYKTDNNNKINNLFIYLNKCLEETDDDSEKNKLLEDIHILEQYI